MRNEKAKESPPTVGAAGRRCIDLPSNAPATYENRHAAGKRNCGPPDNTGDNSRSGLPHGVLTAGNSGGQPPANDDLLWAWPKRGGELRASVTVFKGSRFLDIRWWAEKPGGHVATPKGITIPLNAIEDFSGALTAHVTSKRSSGA